ncbi:MAG: hypothetical protein EAX95_12225 [Candidatus Thorarchaeota archaeon]|nr:hypothetical protein [Candidatus Thorarchaeota archaeon]
MIGTGWLLDASVDFQKGMLTLWIKSAGTTRGYSYEFYPSVFVSVEQKQGTEWTNKDLLLAVQEHPKVTRSEFVQRFVSVYDDEMSLVLQVFTTPDAHWEVAKDLERLPSGTVFHADIDPVQQFFIEEEVFPFGRVKFQTKGERIVELKCLDRREASEYEVPNLDEVGFEIFVDTESIVPKMEDPIHHIDLFHEGKTYRIGEEDEKAILIQFQEAIDTLDPDVIVTRGGDEDVFRYLTLRAKLHGFQLVMSRDGTPLKVVHKEPQSFWQYNQIVYKAGNQVMFNGRIHIDQRQSSYYSPQGMEGVIEGCRLALAQPQKVARMSIGTVNASVQYYNAFKMGILIPPIKRNPEFLKTVTDLAIIDRGGLILQPKPDIYDNIAECDFSSMYPTLMVTRNISPETICTRTECPYDYKYCIDVPEVNFRLCNRKRGLVSKSLELVVQKRKDFKRLIEEGHDAEKYERMQNTLKGILVSCFGYLGFKNARFGRVEAHTAVTALARDVMLRTQEIGEQMGFELVHGIVDSVWIKSKEKIEYERVWEFCRRVTEAVDIKMSPKGVYRWLVIPSSRLHPSIAPLNRYYGVYRNGAIKTRGIEMRRRDTCIYVGDCQKEMIKTLARGRNKAEFIELIPAAYSVCRRFIDKLYEGNIDLRDLILHTRLTREPDAYRANSRAAIVARQLVENGKELHAGQKVRYIMVSGESESPMRRVRAIELLDETTRYDSEAYATLCLRAFENLIPSQYLQESVMEEQGEAVQATL